MSSSATTNEPRRRKLPVVTRNSPEESDGSAPVAGVVDGTPAPNGAGCHGGAERLRAAVEAGESSKVLEELVKDYPLGPHDKPQGMCPAFGSLRVGLRMRRTATILSG